MVASLRELRQRRDSVATTMKITKAMEMIAASRVTKAQNKALGSQPFTLELRRAVSTVAAFSNTDHPLNREHNERLRSAVLVISSDRGLAGGYPASVTRAAQQLLTKLDEAGVKADIYACGKRAREFFEFREIELAGSWEGFSEAPRFEHAKEIGDTLMERFLTKQEDGGVGEVHVVFTEFLSLVSQRARIVRLLPLLLVDAEQGATLGEDTVGEFELNKTPSGIVPEYSFEPNPESVLDDLLPMYIVDTIKFMLRESAASELAARQQAMHSATDNAQKLIQDLTRQANQARQAEITQEITEIVSGAGALADGQEN